MPGTVDNALKCDQMVDFVRIHHKLEDIPYILVDVGVYNMLVCTILREHIYSVTSIAFLTICLARYTSYIAMVSVVIAKFATIKTFVPYIVIK